MVEHKVTEEFMKYTRLTSRVDRLLVACVDGTVAGVVELPPVVDTGADPASVETDGLSVC